MQDLTAALDTFSKQALSVYREHPDEVVRQAALQLVTQSLRLRRDWQDLLGAIEAHREANT